MTVRQSKSNQKIALAEKAHESQQIAFDALSADAQALTSAKILNCHYTDVGMCFAFEQSYCIGKPKRSRILVKNFYRLADWSKDKLLSFEELFAYHI